MFRILYSSDNFHLKFDPVHRIQQVDFCGDISDKEYKANWERGMQHILEKGINRVLFDLREVGKISAIARGWAVVSAFPKIQQHFSNDFAVAILTANRPQERPAIQYLAGTFQSITGFKLTYCSTEQEAIDWLKTANVLPQLQLPTF